MHIQLTFQLVTKRLFFIQFAEHSHKSTTAYPLQKQQQSSLYHLPFLLFTQLHHNSHTTNSISFYRSPQHISPSFHPQHPSTLSSPSHLLQTTHINHPLSLFFTNVSPLPLSLPKFHVPTNALRRPSGLPSNCKLWWAAPSFLW